MSFVPFQAVQRVGSDYWYHTCCAMHALPHRANMWDWRVLEWQKDFAVLEFVIDKEWLQRFPGHEYGFDIDPRPRITTQDLLWDRIQSMQKGWLERSSWVKARLSLRLAPDVSLANIWRVEYFVRDWLRVGRRYAFRMHDSPGLKGEVVYGIYRGVDCPLCVKLSPIRFENQNPFLQYEILYRMDEATRSGVVQRNRHRRYLDLIEGSFSYLVETGSGIRKIWSRNLEAITGT